MGDRERVEVDSRQRTRGGAKTTDDRRGMATARGAETERQRLICLSTNPGKRPIRKTDNNFTTPTMVCGYIAFKPL